MDKTGSVLNVKQGDIESFRRMLESKTPFAFSRYGDGEFASILGFPGKNCDGVKYTPELQFALVETLKYPHLEDNYYYGILAVALRLMRPHIERFTVINNLDITWIEATFLVGANRQGKLSAFLQTLRDRPMVYVGPSYLQDIKKKLKLPIAYFIDVPEKGAFESRYRTLERIHEHSKKADLIGFSAGPGTKWLIWSLFHELGSSHTLFDFGSIFDGYVGRPSRKYQRRDTWEQVVKMNLS